MALLLLCSEYAYLLFARKFIRYIAKELGMAMTTAFYWRHKILAPLGALTEGINPVMTEVVEADETYLNVSYKGQKSGIPRPSKKRGAPSKVGISREQACVLVATDRRKHSHMKSACLGRPKSSHIEKHLEDRVSQESVLVTDKHSSYRRYCRNHGITHKTVSSSRNIRGNYHIQTVNSLHSHFKSSIRCYRGIAAKYLDNYLVLFEWARRYPPKLSQATDVLSARTFKDFRQAKMSLV